MLNAVWTCNPPYNDGSAGNAPIYQHFVEKVKQYKPRAAVIIVQANWMMQSTALGKQMRRDLKVIGVKRLILNPVDAFPNAKVRTVSMICEPGYQGKIEFVDAATKEQRLINNFDELIPFIGNGTKVNLLERLKAQGSWLTWQGNTGNTNKWRVVVSYKNFEIKKDPLGHLKVIDPNFAKQSGYRVFAEFDTEADAVQALDFYRSFWKSKLVSFILKYTRVSNTLDNPQIAWVPKMSLTKVYSDQDIYNHFNLTQDEQRTVDED
jgi:hypothetical protein